MLKNVMAAYNDDGVGFKICRQYPTGINLKSIQNFLLITDNDFKVEINNLDPNDIKHKILNDLFNRNLFQRVLKISLQTVTTEDDRKAPQLYEPIKAHLAAFNNIRNDSERKKDLIAEILKECSQKSISKYEVAIDIPHQPNFDKAGQAMINLSSSPQNPQMVRLKDVIPIDAWIKGYETYFSHAYIFGPSDKKTRVALAIASAKVLQQNNNGNIYLPLTISAITEDIRQDVIAEEKKQGLSLFRK